MSELGLDYQVKYLHGTRFKEFWEDYFKDKDESICIYIDFPYCVSTCNYCLYQPDNFHKNRNVVPIYEKRLVELIKEMKDILSPRPLKMISFGGGTASLMTRETIHHVMESIPTYRSAIARKVEVHPKDLNPEYVRFLLEEMNINCISIGIQSFDPEANQNQHRIPAHAYQLNSAVKELQANNVYVNIDIVALFDGEEERDWKIFENDLKVLEDLIQPDSFFPQVNFATEGRYYEHSKRFRMILQEFLKTTKLYSFGDERYHSLDMRDIEEFLDSPYFLINSKYQEFILKNNLNMTSKTDTYIGFGGNEKHQVFSTTKDGQVIYSYYDHRTDRFIHRQFLNYDPVVKIEKGEPIPTIEVGRFIITPSTSV